MCEMCVGGVHDMESLSLGVYDPYISRQERAMRVSMCMHACMQICTHTCMHACFHTYVHMYMSIDLCMCTHTYIVGARAGGGGAHTAYSEEVTERVRLSIYVCDECVCVCRIIYADASFMHTGTHTYIRTYKHTH